MIGRLRRWWVWPPHSQPVTIIPLVVDTSRRVPSPLLSHHRGETYGLPAKRILSRPRARGSEGEHSEDILGGEGEDERDAPLGGVRRHGWAIRVEGRIIGRHYCPVHSNVYTSVRLWKDLCRGEVVCFPILHKNEKLTNDRRERK